MIFNYVNNVTSLNEIPYSSSFSVTTLWRRPAKEIFRVVRVFRSLNLRISEIDANVNRSKILNPMMVAPVKPALRRNENLARIIWHSAAYNPGADGRRSGKRPGGGRFEYRRAWFIALRHAHSRRHAQGTGHDCFTNRRQAIQRKLFLSQTAPA